MSFSRYTLQPFGENAILIKWEALPSHDLFKHLSLAKEVLENHFQSEVILTYQELLIKNISTTRQSLDQVAQCLEDIQLNTIKITLQRKLRIPVCYEAQFGTDLEALAKAKSLSTQEVIKLHSTPEYLVYFMGFLPGFPYLLGLDQQLHTPRKAVPSRELLAGSVAIGGEQTGIYPQNSPGGWQVIGHCPISLFDAKDGLGSLFQTGDRIKFEAITKQEHNELSKLSLLEFKNSAYLSHG